MKVTKKQVEQALTAAVGSLDRKARMKVKAGVKATTVPPKMLRLAKTPVERELLYYTNDSESTFLSDILDQASGVPPDQDSALRGADLAAVKKVAEGMVRRGLLVEEKNGGFKRGKSAMDFGEVRELAFQTLPLTKALAEHLSKLSEQIPDDHDAFEIVTQALEEVEKLLIDVRALGHAFE